MDARTPRVRWAARRCLGAALGLAVAASVAVTPTAAAVTATPSTVTSPAITVAHTTTTDQRYITSVYRDLFGRDPEPQGLAFWTTAVHTGTPRIAVANAITSSDEFRMGLITDSYEYYLGRQPDAAGMQHWLERMHRGLTIAQLEAGFLASDEFFVQSKSNNGYWIWNLYRVVLGRESSLDESIHWGTAMRPRLLPGSTPQRLASAPGLSRQEVAMGFLLSTEHLSTVVDGYYRHLLGRGLDPSGLGTWVTRLQTGGRDEEIVGGILASEEYWMHLGR